MPPEVRSSPSHVMFLLPLQREIRSKIGTLILRSKKELTLMFSSKRCAKKLGNGRCQNTARRFKGCPRLGELRWKSGGRQHRLIGYFKNGIFVALIGCTHKMNIYSPQNAIEEADNRRDRIERKEATTSEYKL